MWSADVAMQEDDAEEQVEFSGPVAWTTIATSLAFAVAIFFLSSDDGQPLVCRLL